MASTNFLQATPRLPYRRTIRRNDLIVKRVNLIIINSHQDKSKENENMIVLKMRIKKMKVLEGKGGGGAAPPNSSDWKEWERKVFTHYHEGVCDCMEMLQAYLMNTRPSVAIGMMALIAMSLPLSSSVVMMNFLKVAKGLLAGCHVCIDIDF